MGIWKRSGGIKIFQNSPEWPSFRELFDFVLPGWRDDDIISSPYSIALYLADAMIGTWEEVDKVREELHKRGMRLVLDFVLTTPPPDHPWIFEHPDYYF
jgi:hypothetical protein